MTDNRFPSPGVDNRFPSPGVDTYYITPGIDAQYPNPGEDARFMQLSPVTAIVMPATSILFVGDALDDTTNWATFLNLSNYATSAEGETINSVVVNYIGDTATASEAFIDGDSNHFSVTVTDTGANENTFLTAARTVTSPVPVEVEVDGSTGEILATYPDDTPGATIVEVTVNSGTYLGTYTQRVTDSATLTVGMIEAAETPLVLPVITGLPLEEQTLTLVPGLWIYGGGDPGDQTFLWVNNTTGSLGDTDTSYTIVTDDVGDTLRVDETFGGVTISSANTAVITAGTPPFPDAFVDANWSVSTGGTGTANSLLITVVSLPADNGDAITDIQYDVGGNNTWTSLGISTATTATIGLPLPERLYDIRLRAVNSGGNGNAGNTESATSGAGTPAVVIDWNPLTGAGLNEVNITITTDPVDNGSAITDYEYRLDQAGSWISLGISAPGTVTVTMAAADTEYTFEVRAVNAVGAGSASTPEVSVSGDGVAPDPEAGLSLTSSHAIGAIPDATFADLSPCVFAADFTGLVIEADRMIWTQGAGGQCATLYFDGSGDLILRAGEGFNAALPDPDNASIVVPSASVPGSIGTAVWEVTPDFNTVRLFLDGVEFTDGKNDSAQSQRWGWTANGGYLNSPGGAPGYVPNTVITYTTASTLRYYENQQVSI